MSETGALSRLSLRALRSAEALGTSELSALFDHLYSYNTLAPTGVLKRRFADAAAVRGELGLNRDQPAGTRLVRHWSELPRHDREDWLAWTRPGRHERLAGPASGVELKLYVSPAVEALPTAVAAVVDLLCFSEATSFKLGATAADLLRPDKMVVYFRSLEDLAEFSRRLAEGLAGTAAQGVPFTAEIAAEGLLSWGVDPPARARGLGEPGRSWRQWVCHQLAVGLVEARQEQDVAEPLWPRALERLRRRGIDVDRWLPPTASWIPARGGA